MSGKKGEHEVKKLVSNHTDLENELLLKIRKE